MLRAANQITGSTDSRVIWSCHQDQRERTATQRKRENRRERQREEIRQGTENDARKKNTREGKERHSARALIRLSNSNTIE